jgi:hypothetical protein
LKFPHVTTNQPISPRDLSLHPRACRQPLPAHLAANVFIPHGILVPPLCVLFPAKAHNRESRLAAKKQQALTGSLQKQAIFTFSKSSPKLTIS